jgi:hypothetical protein
MPSRVCLSALVGCLGLAACRATAEPGTARPEANAPHVGSLDGWERATAEPERFRPEEMTLVGTYVHEGSGVAFPERAAGFDRVAPKRYDLEERDVGIGYRRVWLDLAMVYRAEVTLYVFPPPRTVAGRELTHDEQFEGEVRALSKGRSGIREVRRTTTPAVFRGETVSVRAAEFAYFVESPLGPLPMLTLVAGFPFGEWRVTYRATLPPPRRALTLSAFEALVSELGLPPTGLPASAAAPE